MAAEDFATGGHRCWMMCTRDTPGAQLNAALSMSETQIVKPTNVNWIMALTVCLALAAGVVAAVILLASNN